MKSFFSTTAVLAFCGLSLYSVPAGASSYGVQEQTVAQKDVSNPSNPLTAVAKQAPSRAISRMAPVSAQAEPLEHDWFSDPVGFFEYSGTFAQADSANTLLDSDSHDFLAGFDFISANDILVGLMVARGETTAQQTITNAKSNTETNLISMYISDAYDENWVYGSAFSHVDADTTDNVAGARSSTRTYTYSIAPFVAYTDVYGENSYWSITTIANYQSATFDFDAAGLTDVSQQSLDITVRGAWDYDYNEALTLSLLGSYTIFVDRDQNTGAAFAATRGLDKTWGTLGAGFSYDFASKWATNGSVESDLGNQNYDTIFVKLGATYVF